MISGICALSLIMLTQNAYAQTYEKESASGKFGFSEFEVPEELERGRDSPIYFRKCAFVDSEKAYKDFIEGKEILEKHNTPASNLYPVKKTIMF